MGGKEGLCLSFAAQHHTSRLREVQTGFAEVSALSASCRFQDCLHAREPDCAVRDAVAAGAVNERRYESYRRLLNLTRQLDERRGYRS